MGEAGLLSYQTILVLETSCANEISFVLLRVILDVHSLLQSIESRNAYIYRSETFIARGHF